MQVYVCIGAEGLKTILHQWVLSYVAMAGNSLSVFFLVTHPNMLPSWVLLLGLGFIQICLFSVIMWSIPREFGMQGITGEEDAVIVFPDFWRKRGIAGSSHTTVLILFHSHVRSPWAGRHTSHLVQWKMLTTPMYDCINYPCPQWAASF